MADFISDLASGNLLLFIILLVNLVLVAYVVIYVAFYVLKRKQPGRIMYNIFWRMKSIKGGKVSTVDEAYGLIMESLKREGILSQGDGSGLLARNKAMRQTEGKKNRVLKQLFDIYEAKKYAGRGVRNEAETASGIVSSYLES